MTLKLLNEYAELFGRDYTDTPKAVLAAALVSYLTRSSECDGNLPTPEQAQQLLRMEWRILHENGIVQQRPPRL